MGNMSLAIVRYWPFMSNISELLTADLWKDFLLDASVSNESW